MKSKTWGGRFKTAQTQEFLHYSASIHFDHKLAPFDIMQNRAYAKGLCKAGILTAKERDRLIKALDSIEKEFEKGDFRLQVEDEDIHMNIERRLREKVGKLAGKIHTGRSRNDQVATDLRLYVRQCAAETVHLIKKLEKTLVRQAEKNIELAMPAYTHLQMAQPVRAAHWFLAYREMFRRDRARFQAAHDAANVMPLGSGALAGNNYGIDRAYLARQMKFDGMTVNSLDGVSDRDFALDFCYAAGTLFSHFSRLSEELIIYSSQEFGTVNLPEELCTGSSIMPQKKNPDLPELLRGKTGRVTGNLLNLLTILKSLPLAYNKDMQEDKPPVFDSAEQALTALPLVEEMVRKMTFNKKTLAERVEQGYLTAVDLADYLALKGMPFRDAHHVVGAIVAECEEAGKTFKQLSLAEFRRHSKLFEKDIYDFVDPQRSPDRKKGTGAPSRTEIKKQIAAARKELKK